MYSLEVVLTGGTSLKPEEPRVVARGNLASMLDLFPVLVQCGEYDRVALWDPTWETLEVEWEHRGLPVRYA